jgi:hypothetical protein
MVEKGSTVTPEDLGRYKQQFNCTIEICAVLDKPNQNDDTYKEIESLLEKVFNIFYIYIYIFFLYFILFFIH